MTILQIEYATSDFEAWKRAFDRGWTLCAARRRGLRRHRVLRGVDDPDCVKVDLEFETESEAEAIQAALRELWDSGLATPGVGGGGRARVVKAVDSEEHKRSAPQRRT